MFQFPETEHQFPVAQWPDHATALLAGAPEPTVQRLRAVGFGAVCLPDDILHNEPYLLSICRACHEHRLGVWLGVALPRLQRKSTLRVVVDEVPMSALLQFISSQDADHPVSFVAVPLASSSGQVLWEQSVQLAGLDFAQQKRALLNLGAAGATRLWRWFVRPPANGQVGGDGLAQQIARIENLVAALDNAGARACLRGVYVDAVAESSVEQSNELPWLKGIHQTFAARNVDPRACLPALVADVGEASARLRQQFWEILAEHSCSTVWQPLRARLQELGLRLRAAVPGQQSLVGAVFANGSLTRFCGAVDEIAVAPPPQPGPRLNLCRVAHGTAALANTAEAGTAGKVWAQYRPLFAASEIVSSAPPPLHDWLFAGADGFQEPLPSASIPQTPADFNTYLARSCALRAWGRPGARVALFWPERSIQSHLSASAHRIVRWIEEDFSAATLLLDELHFDFVTLDEATLCKGAVHLRDSGGCTLQCGNDFHFDLIVLPSVSALSWPAWHKLDRFVEAGGKVVCLGLLPRWSELGRDTQLEECVGKTTMLTVSDLYEAYAGAEGGAMGDAEASVIGYPIVRTRTSGGRLCCYQPRLNTDTADARLRVRQMLADCVLPEVESQALGLRVTRRVGGSGELFWCWNSGLAQKMNLRLRTTAAAAPFEVDVETGSTRPLLEWMGLPESEGGGVALSMFLESGEARALWLEHGAYFRHAERANFTIETLEPEAIAGYATGAEAPFAAVRIVAGEALTRWQGSGHEVPPPLGLEGPWELADEDVEMEASHKSSQHLTRTVLFPAGWANCRVFLELRDVSGAARVSVNGHSTRTLCAPPRRFDITQQMQVGLDNEIVLQLSGTDASSFAARLVAYPTVKLTRPH